MWPQLRGAKPTGGEPAPAARDGGAVTTGVLNQAMSHRGFLKLLLAGAWLVGGCSSGDAGATRRSAGRAGEAVEGDFTVGGNLGVGTTSPDRKVVVDSERSGGDDLQLSHWSNDSQGPIGLRFRKAKGSKAAPSAVRAGDMIGSISYRGWGDTGFPADATARIAGHADEDFTDRRMGTSLRFSATPVGSLNAREVARVYVAGDGGRLEVRDDSVEPLAAAGVVLATKGDRALISFSPQVGLQVRVAGPGQAGIVVAGGGRVGINNEAPKFSLDAPGRVAVGVPPTAPTDANLSTSQMSFYLDEGGHTLKVRVKYSDGRTIREATIPLQPLASR